MEVEPWEALDLDDSDLPSLLRPCKRHRFTSLTTTTAAAAVSVAVAVPAAANTVSQSPPSKSLEENHPEQQQQPSTSTSGRRAIPGPAGSVQAAMLRKYRESHNSDGGGDNGEEVNRNRLNDGAISTQDYIRRAMENTSEFDDDFARHPWLSALQFVGAEIGLVQSTSISSIKKCLDFSKVVKVVAVVKSCTPNGLGGLIVSLKDPTGSIGASIHHKVLSESEFGKNLTVGAVLILQEVAIFIPVRSTHYLNITLRNLVKVFCKDSGSTSKLNSSAYPVRYADPGIEYCGKGKRSESMSNMQNVSMENIGQRHCTRQNLFNASIRSNNGAIAEVSGGGREHMNLGQDDCNEIPQGMVRSMVADDHHEGLVKASDKGAKGGTDLEGSLSNKTKNVTTTSGGNEIEGSDEVEMQRQPMISKASLPQWTDEQLDQLFAGDEDDDVSLV